MGEETEVKHILIEKECPRCHSERKYERDDSPLYGCWHRWHQELTIDTAWNDTKPVVLIKEQR